MVPSENGNLPEYREVTGTPPGAYWASWALVEKEEGLGQGGHAPLPPSLVLVGLGEGAAPLSLSSPSGKPSWTRIGGGGNPSPGGSRTPLARLLWPAAPLPLLLYIRGQGGTPRHTS